MSCPTADMESCDKKCKCVGGPCPGTAYDCANPCKNVDEEFDASTCQCVGITFCGCGPIRYTVTWDNYRSFASCTTNSSCTASCSQNDGEGNVCGDGVQTLTGVIQGNETLCYRLKVFPESRCGIDGWHLFADIEGYDNPDFTGNYVFRQRITAPIHCGAVSISKPTAVFTQEPCPPGEELNTETCECESLYGTSSEWRVTYSSNRFQSQPCDGIVADPCDVGGSCPTGGVRGGSAYQNFGPYEITPTGWWQGGRYSATNSWCPANTMPDTTTYADMGIPADWVVVPGNFGSYGTREAIDVALFSATSASLVLLGVDQLGDRWAWQVRAANGGTIDSLWKGPGDWAFDMTATPE